MKTDVVVGITVKIDRGFGVEMNRHQKPCEVSECLLKQEVHR
jgi:hypothetical protein